MEKGEKKEPQKKVKELVEFENSKKQNKKKHTNKQKKTQSQRESKADDALHGYKRSRSLADIYIYGWLGGRKAR